MFPRRMRIARKDFMGVHRAGRAYSNEYATLRLSRVGGAGRPTRFAVVVSAKVEKRAVSRNRLKRRVRHILAARAALAGNGAAIILYLKKPAAGLPARVLAKAIEPLLAGASAPR